jgi:hypothetical protein
MAFDVTLPFPPAHRRPDQRPGHFRVHGQWFELGLQRARRQSSNEWSASQLVKDCFRLLCATLQHCTGSRQMRSARKCRSLDSRLGMAPALRWSSRRVPVGGAMSSANSISGSSPRRNGSAPAALADQLLGYIRDAVERRRNIQISGGTSHGKTPPS